jgi:hypothetical protein
MPRDIGTGIYYYPSGTQGNSGQTIFSARYNTFINDLTNTLNQPLPSNMGGTGADNPTTARTNLKAEAAGQQVTNYDAHAFEAGSFWSAIGATSAPNGTNRFVGTCIIITDATNDIFIQVTTPGTPNPVYTRRKNGGVWGAWVQQAGSAAELDAAYVNLTGDTMTGALTVPTIYLNATNLLVTDGTNNIIRSNGQVYVQNMAGTLNTLNIGNLTASGSITTGGSLTCNGNIATNAISCSTLTTNGYTLTTNIINCGNVNSSGNITSAGDLKASNGVLRLNAVGDRYLYWDGSNYSLPGGGVFASSFNGTLNGTVNGNVNGSCTGSSSSCTGNAATASSAGSAGGLYGNPGIAVSWIEGPEAIDFKTTGSPSDFDCRFYLQWPNLNINGAPGFDSLVINTRFYVGNGNVVNCPGGIKTHGGFNSGVYAYNINWGEGDGNGAMYIGDVGVGNVLLSDYRIKKDMTPLQSTWEKIKQLNPISYKQKEHTPKSMKEAAKKEGKPLIAEDNTERWGFAAHELQETLCKGAATGRKDADNVLQAPDPMAVIAALTKALQEAMARIEALEAAA